jgi:uncharacterized membrane protein YjdF
VLTLNFWRFLVQKSDFLLFLLPHFIILHINQPQEVITVEDIAAVVWGTVEDTLGAEDTAWDTAEDILGAEGMEEDTLTGVT